LRLIVFSGVLKYVDKSAFNRCYKEVSPTDRLILMLIDRCRNNGDTDDTFISMLNRYDIPTEKSRMKKKLETLINRVDKKSRILPDVETRFFLEAVKLNFWRPDLEQ
jgi:hypothetical protein